MNEDGEAALKFLEQLTVLAFDTSVDIINFIFSLPIKLAKLIFRLIVSIPSLPGLIAGRYWRFYYWLFPSELRKKQEAERKAKLERERREKADLLLEYEELLMRRDDLQDELIDDSNALNDFVEKLGYVIDNCGFEARELGKAPKQVLGKVDVNRIANYEAIKKKAVELEKLTTRGFVVRQKLKLYGIDRGVEENEED